PRIPGRPSTLDVIFAKSWSRSSSRIIRIRYRGSAPSRWCSPTNKHKTEPKPRERYDEYCEPAARRRSDGDGSNVPPHAGKGSCRRAGDRERASVGRGGTVRRQASSRPAFAAECRCHAVPTALSARGKPLQCIGRQLRLLADCNRSRTRPTSPYTGVIQIFISHGRV